MMHSAGCQQQRHTTSMPAWHVHWLRHAAAHTCTAASPRPSHSQPRLISTAWKPLPLPLLPLLLLLRVASKPAQSASGMLRQ